MLYAVRLGGRGADEGSCAWGHTIIRTCKVMRLVGGKGFSGAYLGWMQTKS